MNLFRHVNSGDKLRIPARAWNAVQDGARAALTGRPAGAPSLGLTGECVVILVENVSGADLDEFSVVGLGEPAFTPTDNLSEFQYNVCLQADVPASSDAGRFAILQEASERTKLIYAWPTDQSLWDRYADLRRARGRDAATKFYAAHREEMDRGAAVAWPARFDEKAGELSAIQHAMNLRLRMGPEGFAAECQNEPVLQQTADGALTTWEGGVGR